MLPAKNPRALVTRGAGGGEAVVVAAAAATTWPRPPHGLDPRWPCLALDG
jgi:hypothetical protein